MSRINFNRTIVLTTAVLMIAALLCSGCSQSPTATIDTETQPPQVLQRAAASTDANLAPVNLYKEQVISSAEGGQLVLLDVTLDVPPGAVPNDTIFSVYIPDDEIFYNEFGTDGLVFAEPVTVTMSYRGADISGIDESTIRIGFYNQKTGAWEDTECLLDRENKLVIAKLYHFSPYGLISD